MPEHPAGDTQPPQNSTNTVETGAVKGSEEMIKEATRRVSAATKQSVYAVRRPGADREAWQIKTEDVLAPAAQQKILAAVQKAIGEQEAKK